MLDPLHLWSYGPMALWSYGPESLTATVFLPKMKNALRFTRRAYPEAEQVHTRSV